MQHGPGLRPSSGVPLSCQHLKLRVDGALLGLEDAFQVVPDHRRIFQKGTVRQLVPDDGGKVGPPLQQGLRQVQQFQRAFVPQTDASVRVAGQDAVRHRLHAGQEHDTRAVPVVLGVQHVLQRSRGLFACNVGGLQLRISFRHQLLQLQGGVHIGADIGVGANHVPGGDELGAHLQVSPVWGLSGVSPNGLLAPVLEVRWQLGAVLFAGVEGRIELLTLLLQLQHFAVMGLALQHAPGHLQHVAQLLVEDQHPPVTVHHEHALARRLHHADEHASGFIPLGLGPLLGKQGLLGGLPGHARFIQLQVALRKRKGHLLADSLVGGHIRVGTDQVARGGVVGRNLQKSPILRLAHVFGWRRQ